MHSIVLLLVCQENALLLLCYAQKLQKREVNTVNERFLNSKDLAERYGISPQSIRQFAREGKLPPPLKIGGVQRWSEADILAFEEKRKEKQA